MVKPNRDYNHGMSRAALSAGGYTEADGLWLI